jgi:hypothetical protein
MHLKGRVHGEFAVPDQSGLQVAISFNDDVRSCPKGDMRPAGQTGYRLGNAISGLMRPQQTALAIRSSRWRPQAGIPPRSRQLLRQNLAFNSGDHPILQVPSFGGAMVSISTLGSGTVPSAS